jgi:hypothetical protein
LQIDMMQTARLVRYIRNARTHSADQVAQIAASIAEFGFTNPILIGEDDVIIAGHGRLMAAQSLGLAQVPVIVLDRPFARQDQQPGRAEAECAGDPVADTGGAELEGQQPGQRDPRR